MLTPAQAQSISEAHDAYWSDRRSELRDNRNVYMTNFWGGQGKRDARRTEVPKAYAVVESYLGSLFAKDPAVKVDPDLRGRGNPEVAQATANQYLLTIREQFEDATRLALIYPCSFLKLSSRESTDPLKRVGCSALPPWEVVLDATAPSWDQQRWVGHTYVRPVDEAAEAYGKSVDEFTTHPYVKWLDQNGVSGSYEQESDLGVDSSEQWVRVVELYDIRADKMLVWSPDYADGKEFVFTGVRVQVGALDEGAEADGETPDSEIVHETTGIPFKTASGTPVVPVIPVYLARDPDSPLRGYSLVSRSYDQFRELNVLRTYQSQGVRRMARQWLMRAGFLDEAGIAKVAEGLDGEFIEVDLPPGAALEGNIAPVPNAPVPADIEIYANTVEGDINDAGLMAPFTRGEVTKATATEQRLLADYTSSELGRMARTRDGAITSVARVYNIMLSVLLGDEAEPLALPNPVGPTMLSADDLTGDFTYWAQDQGSTPMGDEVKRQGLERLAPLLIQLGTDPEAIRTELVRVHDFPPGLREAAPPPEPVEPVADDVPPEADAEAPPVLPFPGA